MEASADKLKAAIEKLYAGKGENDVTVQVDDLYSARADWKPNETVKNFVARISIDDPEKKPRCLLTILTTTRHAFFTSTEPLTSN